MKEVAIVTVVFNYCTCLGHADGSREGMNHTGVGERSMIWLPVYISV